MREVAKPIVAQPHDYQFDQIRREMEKRQRETQPYPSVPYPTPLIPPVNPYPQPPYPPWSPQIWYSMNPSDRLDAARYMMGSINP